MITKLDKGSNFEAEVATLLKLCGYMVERERLLGHKKVDLYFEERRFGSIRRVAVECKAFENKISNDILTNIWADYHSLYDSNLIDEVLVITQNGLAPAAETKVKETRHLSHVTYTDLQINVMDFTQYLSELVEQYHIDGLSEYYIDLRLNDGTYLESMVFEWIRTPNSKPLAVLGSYGLGKTTFALRISHVLAKRAIKDRQNRIPILIRLGDIGTEQSLEGLLGRSLTTTTLVHNYSFNALMRLNREGRLIFILDGFDEMKHTLSWDQFRYNFSQLNRLIVGDSRVLLLGRPTAFLNDEEYQYALHGIRPQTDTGHQFRDPNWPDYEELHIGTFKKIQIVEFLQKYWEYRSCTSKESDEKRKINFALNYRLEDISGKYLSDISKRPVQLRMLADIFPQWEGSPDSITTAILYSEFIDLMIERELQKDSRLKFGKKERRCFARELALWLWTSWKESSITADNIPTEIIKNYATNDKDIPSVRRDLVAACFLERKLGEALYFPHRSMQEFLVAEEIVEQIDTSRITFDKVDVILTEEVSEFLCGIVNIKTFQNWEPMLKNYNGTVSWRLAKVWLTKKEYAEYLMKSFKNTQISWVTFLLTLGICKGNFKDKDVNILEICNVLIQRIKSGDLNYAILCYFCVVALTSVMSKMQPIVTALSHLLGRGKYVSDIRERENEHRSFSVHKVIVDLSAKVFMSKKQNAIELGGTYPWLCSVLKNYCFLTDWIVGSTIQTDDIKLPLRVYIKEVKDWESIAYYIDRLHEKV